MAYPNWFAGVQYNFETQLAHLKGEPNLNFLQIGAYTGDASEWLLTNILTDPSSTLLDVDTWEGSDESEHKSINFDDVYEFYKKRMEPYPNIRSVKNNSENFLKSNKTTWDFIYIDGNHTEEVVWSDAIGSWPLLKSGGILAFDDYLWTGSTDCPKPSIDKFLEEYKDDIVLLEHGYQVWVRKK